MNDWIIQLGNILGCILQPLYTCLFILNTKQLKEKRIYFIILMIIDYTIILKLLSFKSGINADLIFVISMYLNLKMIYRNKARITDLITYVISDIGLGIISILSYFIFGMNIVGLIFALATPLIVLALISKKLNIIEQFYEKYWNRKKHKVKIKSITVRGISLCMTVFVSLLLHFWIIYLILK